MIPAVSACRTVLASAAAVRSARKPIISEAALILLLLGTACGLVQAFSSGLVTAEMNEVARNMVKGNGFANPTSTGIETGPSAFVPPIYPYFMAGCSLLFGRVWSLVAIWTAAAVAYGAHAAMYPTLAEGLFGERRIGIWAGAFAAFLPFFWWYPSWDTIWTATAIVGLCAFWIKHRSHGMLGHFGVGSAAGLAFLLNPASALVLVPMPVFFRAGRWTKIAVFWAAMALTISPWLIRNYVALGACVVRTNFGVSLQASNNSCLAITQAAFNRSDCLMDHPTASRSQALIMRNLGEVRYDRYKLHEAETWILANKTHFMQLTAFRIIQFWFPDPKYYPKPAIYLGMITLLSLCGLFQLRKRRATIFLIFVLLSYPLMYYIIVADPRYRVPILWASLLLAGAFLNSRFRPPSPYTEGATRGSGAQ